MQKLPKISIITPSYNQGEFLEECIKSVLMQDYESFEYIIIDGGSTDNSVEIIKSYEDRLTYWVSEEDAGQSEAINKGFKLATGEIVAWINSDDFFYQGAFECIKDQYIKKPDASFYYGNGARVDGSGNEKSSFYTGDVPEFNLDALIYGLNYILQPSTFINHALLRKAGLLDEALHYGMDGDLWIRLAKLSPPQKIEKTLSATREYGATKTSTGSFERIEELRLISCKYSSCPITPGVLLYFLDTLNNYLDESDAPFQPWFKDELIMFWEVASENLRKYATGSNGMPLKSIGNVDSSASIEETRTSLLGKEKAKWLEQVQQLQAVHETDKEKFEIQKAELNRFRRSFLIRVLDKLNLI